MMIARLIGVGKEYQVGDQTIVALKPVDLEIYEGQLVLIIGPSGSGKTTLLSLIGCVIYPTYGELYVSDKLVNEMSQKQLASLRLNTIGFVFQSFNLIAPLNSFDNVLMPLQLKRVSVAEARKKAEDALALVGMLDRRKSLPKQLSGGQQQRVAIARALVTDPKLILCDEPTASLDATSISTVMNELVALAKGGKSVCVVTHDPRLLSYADRVIKVDGGEATEIEKDGITNSFSIH
ncbi:MAG: ABC transporter ATP-binding protein [Flavobacteriales bacterium]|nr:ABC transporter ATP-binding protein [Flavobacteriales bacterium]NDA97588.1 ABC transporter ATP-binding protein [Flavobacteriia bacterium]NDC27885.1 ABC transporter ATP-binding protein [Crocinitomicaceae bacterium]NDC92222.1 ABC transporter ATP-binding protein [Flavobacteriales bacterium]